MFSDAPDAVSADRDESEDAVYRTFGTAECFVAPSACRRSAHSIDQLEAAAKGEAMVEVVGRYFDIDIVIHDSSVRDLVVDRVARVVAGFNQL